MVYKRKSVSNMAAAAAGAAWMHQQKGLDMDLVAAHAVAAVHETTPDNAPAHAAKAAKSAGARDGICIAIAAGVAAAADGRDFKVVQDVSVAAAYEFAKSRADTSDKRGHDAAATVALNVAEAVHTVSSRYPAVEAAAAAAYVVQPTGGTTAANEASAVNEPAAIGAAKAAAAAAATAAKAIKRPGVFSAGLQDNPNTVNASRVPTRTPGDPARGGDSAAGNAAGETAAITKSDGPDCLSFAAQVAAKAATARGATLQLAVTAAVKAVTSTMVPASANHPGREKEAADAIASGVSCLDWNTPSISLGACGKEWMEAIPKSHELTYKKLGTIVGLDTFLAGFLLFALTGELRMDDGSTDSASSASSASNTAADDASDDDDNPANAEVVQIILQAYTFFVFLAATMSAGGLLVLTGDKHILSTADVGVPEFLSVAGFLLLLVTVADAVFLEFGECINIGDDHHALYWITIAVGGMLQLFGILTSVFKAGAGSALVRSTWHSSKYKLVWACSPRCKMVVEPNRWDPNA